MKYVLCCSACLLQISTEALHGSTCPSCHSGDYVVRMELHNFLAERARIKSDMSFRRAKHLHRMDAGRS